MADMENNMFSEDMDELTEFDALIMDEVMEARRADILRWIWIGIFFLLLVGVLLLAGPLGKSIDNHVWKNSQQSMEDTVGSMNSQHTITLYGTLPADTYTLKLENENGPIPNYADICVLEKTASGSDVEYHDLIIENAAPPGAAAIGVYHSSGEKAGSIPLPDSYKCDPGKKLYSFGVVSDVHIGYETAESDFRNALTYLTQTENVSMICIPGDLTAACQTEELTVFKNIVAECAPATPVYAITGNHDTEQYHGSKISDSINQYTGQPMYYSVAMGEDIFIFMGEYNGYDAGRLYIREQLQWFYETLEANRDKRCFVFSHIRPDSTAGNPNDLQSIDLWDGTEAIIFEDLLAHYPNVTFFHGHSHTTLSLQSDSDIANYDSSLGCHSIHVPALFGPRKLDEYGYMNNNIEGSEGYVVDVYESAIIVRGFDFVVGKFLPIATYCLDTTLQTVEPNTYVDETVTINCSTILPEWTFHTTIQNGLVEEHADYSTTNLIPVEEGNTYYAHQWYGCIYGADVCYYDAEGVYISKANLWNSDGYFAPVALFVPEDAAAFRIKQWTRADEEKHTKDLFVTYTASS